MAIWVESDLCDGCRRCLAACPYSAIEVTAGHAQVLERCTACGACLEVCAKGALRTDAAPKSIPDFNDRRGIWVFAEQRNGRLSPVALELLGKARELAQVLEQEVAALLLGHSVSPLAETLFAYGADTVFLAEHPALADYRTLPYTQVLADLIRSRKPNILLMGASHIGRDLAPRLARRVGAGLTADCTELAIDPEESILLQTRPAFGGNVMATIVNRYSRPQMATVRPGVMQACKKAGPKQTLIEWSGDLSEKSFGTTLLEAVREKSHGVDLSQAKVIVAGGRGVGDRAGFDKLRVLAGLLEGEVAGTRVTVEEGWLSPEHQVGQTGRSVRPEIYIACGISGAVQHRAGMINSRYIVAINKDARAPIFQVANWGIVGDLHRVVPEMIKQLTQARERTQAF